MMKNTLTLKPLIDDGFRVEYMVGNLETTHGLTFVEDDERFVKVAD